MDSSICGCSIREPCCLICFWAEPCLQRGRRSLWLCRIYRPGAPGPYPLPDVRIFDIVGGGPLCGLQCRLRKPGLFCRQRCSSLRTVALCGYHVCHVSTVAVQRSCKVGVVYDCTGSFRKLHTG